MEHIARTDTELVEASRRGERDAFGQLVNRYQDVVCAVSYSSTGNWALSEDVAQDTFIAAWRQLGQLRETNRLRAWLCGIARNLARKARMRTSREDAGEDAIDAAQAPGANPFDATAQAEVDRVVREALARIPDAYRETLVLYYCEGRSIREVASALGVGEDAAMQRLSRGRRYLADGVTELIERSLRGTRGRTDLRPAVLAALPHVDPIPSPRGSIMWKTIIAALVIAAAGTTTVVAVTSHDSSAPAPSASSAAATAKPVTPAAPTATAAPMHAATLPALPAAQPGSADVAEPPPKVIDKATRDRLAIEQGPSRGPAGAPVTIVVFQDLLCSYCGQVLGTIDQLWDEYPGKLRLVVKQFPVHKEALLAAEASLAAEAQGKFWELHDAMIAHQEDLSRDAIFGYAKDAGLDAKAIADALDHHTFNDDLTKEVGAAKEIGVRATPEFLINGEDVTGARPIEYFRAAIDAALAAAPQ
jgi:RNA polymerase sigma factor (sigma-70 family)